VDQATHNQIVSFIWSIADDVLRDLFKRGTYSDVMLPMCANGRGTPVTHCDSERRG
jgi:type I restriction-modification system DNA methylase subunit